MPSMVVKIAFATNFWMELIPHGYENEANYCKNK
jgi:hypothetical protein